MPLPRKQLKILRTLKESYDKKAGEWVGIEEVAGRLGLPDDVSRSHLLLLKKRDLVDWHFYSGGLSEGTISSKGYQLVHDLSPSVRLLEVAKYIGTSLLITSAPSAVAYLLSPPALQSALAGFVGGVVGGASFGFLLGRPRRD
jgi:hypothetical protein